MGPLFDQSLFSSCVAWLRQSWRGVAVVLALAFVCGSLVPSAGLARKGHKPKRVVPTLKVILPAPGHVTVEVFSFRFTGGNQRRLPRMLRLGAVGAKQLPPSVRVIGVQRTIRKRHSTTYAILLIAINKRNAAAHASNTAAQQSTSSALTLETRPVAVAAKDSDAHVQFCHACGVERLPPKPLFIDDKPICPKCVFLGFTKYNLAFYNVAAQNVDLANPQVPAQAKETAVLVKDLKDLFSLADNGDIKDIFGDSGNPAGPDPTPGSGVLDSISNYDDGHAFGWKMKPTTNRADWRHLTANVDFDVVHELFSRMVDDISRITGADIAGTGPPPPPPPPPPAPASCSGHAMLANKYGGQAHQVVVDFTCPKASTGFSLMVPAGDQITGGQATNSASSGGYSCNLNSAMDTVACTGNTPAGSTPYVQMTTSPNPQAGMKLQLTVSNNDSSTTSFTLTTQ